MCRISVHFDFWDFPHFWLNFWCKVEYVGNVLWVQNLNSQASSSHIKVFSLVLVQNIDDVKLAQFSKNMSLIHRKNLKKVFKNIFHTIREISVWKFTLFYIFSAVRRLTLHFWPYLPNKVKYFKVVWGLVRGPGGTSKTPNFRSQKQSTCL